ncbi:MAG: 1-acyl-sn-glycerol-3-phosphate acyltransferase [Anaerolineae bacterium]|nr:1-acyl-sn-glycerol-3-phosphate acyltransferase [Anaerolineae bacterium]
METTVYRAGQSAVSAYTRYILRMDVRWQAPLPPGPKIIAANHPTTTDPFYLLVLSPEPMSLLITKMAFAVPGFGTYLRAAGHIEVDHENGHPAFEAALTHLRRGGTLGIFPEGSLSPRDGGLARARSGAVRLALSAGVPVVPVGIYLDHERIRRVKTTISGMSETARWYPTGPYALTVGEPMVFSGPVDDRALVGDCSEKLMRRIGQLARLSAWRIDRSLALDSWIMPRPAGLAN